MYGFSRYLLLNGLESDSSFTTAARDLTGQIFYSLREAQVVIEKWRVMYNILRPHSALAAGLRRLAAPWCHSVQFHGPWLLY